MISLDLMKLSEVRKAGDRSNYQNKNYEMNFSEHQDPNGQAHSCVV